jgi:succinoglycan biosynthesis protein ExoM
MSDSPDRPDRPASPAAQQHPRPRVLISHQGCVPTYRKGLFERLGRVTDIDYVVAYGDPPRSAEYITAPGPYAFSTRRIANHELRLGSKAFIWQPLVLAFWQDFDVAILGDELKYLSHLAIIAAAKLRRRPAILWGFGDWWGERDLDAGTLLGRLTAWPKAILRRLLLKVVDGYLVYAAHGANTLAAAGFPQDRIATVYNTVDIDHQRRLRAQALETSEADCRRALRVGPEGPVLLYFGRFRPEKRLDLLIDYARRAAAAGRPVAVAMFGAGREQAALETRATGLDKVVFHEASDGLPLAQALRIATAVVIPGYVGLAITHAFAHGVPIITRENTDHAPEIEYLVPGENGLLLPQDVEAFFTGLDRFLADPELQARLRQGADAFAARLSMDRMAAVFDGLVRSLLRLPPLVGLQHADAPRVVMSGGGTAIDADARAVEHAHRPENPPMHRVSVCICTYDRPHVRETIASVLAQQGLEDTWLEIVIADDHPGSSARQIVAAVAADSAVPVRYVRSAAGNVAAARNACLEAAEGEWIAFIDDDEVAEPTWLSRLVEAQRKYGADVVKGYVRAVYPPETCDWVRAADPYTRDYGATGVRPTLLATGNVLIRRALVEENALRFDPTFGRSGGEDTEFFRRLCGRGARAIACRDAVVEEIVPAYRVTREYLVSRYKRMGQTQGKKARLRLGDQPTLAAAMTALPAVALLWTYPAFRILGPRLGFKAFAKFWYSVGVLDGAMRLRADDMT